MNFACFRRLALAALIPAAAMLLSGGAVERITDSAMDELVVTDTIPLSKAAQACSKIRVLSVAGLLAETILRISNEDSVSSLFME